MKKRTYCEFGAKVAKWLIGQNMKKQELAKQLKISKGYLYRILYGERKGEKVRAEIMAIMKKGGAK